MYLPWCVQSNLKRGKRQMKKRITSMLFDEDRPYIHFMSIMNADGEYCLNGNTRVEIIEGGISGEYKVDEGHVLHYYVGEGSSETYENSKVLPENMVLCYSILTVGAGEIPPIAMSLCNGV